MILPPEVIETNIINVPFPIDGHERIASFFLGNKAENFALMSKLFMEILSAQAEARRDYYPDDTAFITPAMQASSAFKQGTRKLEENLRALVTLLNDYSIPFFSPRYVGHMCFETSMPAILGWMAAILCNPNNVAFETSPITTLLELYVGKDMCTMLGYEVIENRQDTGWGHIACDGTVANLESIWAARNLKFYPLSLREAMKSGRGLEFVASTFRVHTCANPDELALFKDLSVWELLNLRPKEILDIPGRLQDEYGITATFLQNALRPHLVQTISKDILEKEYGVEHPIQYLISSTNHYSWPKGAAIAGIGSENMISIPVDNDARIDVKILEAEIEKRYQRKQALFAVVAVIGTTEEGAMDPLDKIVELREKYQAKGMSWVIHADAAWGGYFASMIRDPPGPPETMPKTPKSDYKFVPSVTLRSFTTAQFQALKDTDSITIDPHKAGYIPYPAGGLCYRDGRMRFLLTWGAPYIRQGDNGDSIGIYGVEGSKPGAAASAVFLHHAVVGLHKEGHGMLLGEVSFTCRRLSAHWAAMSVKGDPYLVVPFNPLLSESHGPDAVEEEKRFIRERIWGVSNTEIIKDVMAMQELRNIGSDLNINAFVCNFMLDGKSNEDVEEANYLNNRIYQRFSITTAGKESANIPLFLTATNFAMADYGECCSNFKRRIGLETESGQDLFVLRNVVMSPFQTAGNFVQTIADEFQKVLEEEAENVILRNTISAEAHEFVMQGTDKLFLVFKPYFHKANGRFQLILCATINKDAWDSYLKARVAQPSAVYTLITQEGILTDMVTAGSFAGTISGEGLSLAVQVTGVQVVKERPLNSRWRDSKYPTTFMPFYIYGTQQQCHIDHMLLRAPNIQLSVDQVELNLDCVLTDEQLGKGAVALLDVHEASMQPIDKTATPSKFFATGRQFGVTIYSDPRAAQAHGPGLANVGEEQIRAKGTLVLGPNVFIDHTVLNTQDFKEKSRTLDYTSRITDIETRAEWKQLLRDRIPAIAQNGVF